MAYKDPASFGKGQELRVIAKLLEEGLDVYLPLLDRQQIDCVVRNEVDGSPVYLDIQIKARSKKTAYGGRFSFKMSGPRRNFFFIFYSESADSTYWVIPSQYLWDEAGRTKSGEYKGLRYITLVKAIKGTGKVVPHPDFEKYKNDLKRLADYRG